ncbi:hypothetical protein BGZ58_002459 [Dissophora ornata]|nr:hypothetical protein BGZ58_002459 [Dissophora ornata]
MTVPDKNTDTTPTEKSPKVAESSSDSGTKPDSSSGSDEATLLEIQSTIKLAQDPPALTKTQQSLNTIGNAAFKAGSKVLEAKDMADTGFSTVKKVLGDTENSVLNNMIQLADKLVDVGKAVPFIAPAFVILKIIIDIEKKAREADEKCQDLMERINFMVSHVLILEKIEVMDTLKTVLQRVQDALKEAASLIEAYRKQGKIARRLKMSNTQNFESMAGKISTCSSDLMMSLQIQQTGDLSVLKRAVPRDVVAEDFIKDNGGQEAINNNPELVKEFATKVHLVMTDQVMDQMQSNMQDLMAQNQHQIEVLIRESSSTNVAETIKAVATQQHTVEYWANIKEIDLKEEDSVQIARVGQLIRWRTWGELVVMPLMLINIGHVQDDLSHYLEIFDVASLEDERRNVLRTGNTRIFRNAPDTETNAFSMGDWVLDQDTQQITGIKLTTKVASSKTPTVCVVPFDPKELKMQSGKSLEYLSRGEWSIYKPDKPYEFPKTVQLGPVLSETRLREPRTFRTKSSPKLPLVLIPTAEMVANNSVMTARNDVDRFLGLWRGLNKAPLSSQTQVIILSAKAEYRLVGEDKYKPVGYFGLRANVQFPLTIGPSEAIDIPFEFLVDKPERAKIRSHTAINYAHLTIQHPLRVRITFTDIDGETVSLVQEYVHSVNGVVTRHEKEDIGYFFVDDVDLSQRTTVTIKESTSPKKYFLGILAGLGMTNKVTEMDLHKFAYKAERTGVTEVDMKLGESNLGLDWTIWALVDLSCRRVYGFKVLLYHGSMTPVRECATLGYAPCPLYGGEGLESRPIQYAEETKILPNVIHRDPTVVVEDDTFDDDVPAPVPTPAPVATTAPVPLVPPVHVPPVHVSSAPISPHATEILPVDSLITSMPPNVAPTEPAVSTNVVETAKHDLVAHFTTLAIPPSTISSPASIPTAPAGVPVTASDPSIISLLQAKINALEARLEASERQDALMTKIMALEKKLEASSENVASVASTSQQSDRVSVLETRLASMDQKLDSMNVNLRLLDGNALRLAAALEKIATVLSA